MKEIQANNIDDDEEMVMGHNIFEARVLRLS
jgi:hypothetical protein